MELLLTPSAWRAFRGADFPNGSWEIEGGEVLHARAGAEPVSLVTRERFADFDVSLEWRVPVGGNSGVLYRVSEDLDEPWQSGPEMQLLDNGNHPDGRVPETTCGALYALQAPQRVPQCPPGLYNVARVAVRGTHVEHWLNGVRVLTCDLASAAFAERVAASKFRDFPQFAKSAEGHLVLQHHGTDAWFRNIRVERS